MAFIFDRLSRDLSAETDNGLIDGVRQELVVYLETAARDTIINDILTLSGIIISIEDDFAIVASRLTMLDEKGVVSNKFAPAWERLHDVRCFSHISGYMVNLTPFIQEYTTLMRESQRGANSISNKIGSQFLGCLWISIYNLTFQSLQLSLKILFPFLKCPYL